MMNLGKSNRVDVLAFYPDGLPFWHEATQILAMEAQALPSPDDRISGADRIFVLEPT